MLVGRDLLLSSDGRPFVRGYRLTWRRALKLANEAALAEMASESKSTAQKWLEPRQLSVDFRFCL
jgi:hypothetical protein